MKNLTRELFTWTNSFQSMKLASFLVYIIENMLLAVVKGIPLNYGALLIGAN